MAYTSFVNGIHNRIATGNLRYSDIAMLPVELGYYIRHTFPFSETMVGVLAEVQKRASFSDTRQQLESAVASKIYPLPMFLMPDFELRSRLFALKAPPISMIADGFYSRLDKAEFDQAFCPIHDFIHVKKFLFMLWSANIPGIKLSTITALQKEMIALVEQWPKAKKAIGFFLIDYLFAEDNINPIYTTQKVPTDFPDEYKLLIKLAKRESVEHLSENVDISMKELRLTEGDLNGAKFLPLMDSTLQEASARFSQIIESHSTQIENDFTPGLSRP